MTAQNTDTIYLFLGAQKRAGMNGPYITIEDDNIMKDLITPTDPPRYALKYCRTGDQKPKPAERWRLEELEVVRHVFNTHRGVGYSYISAISEAIANSWLVSCWTPSYTDSDRLKRSDDFVEIVARLEFDGEGALSFYDPALNEVVGSIDIDMSLEKEYDSNILSFSAENDWLYELYGEE
tara:strand:+ start:253 stop:792 length:540 start_codon:yes stop_codon:yes gene_type:complete